MSAWPARIDRMALPLDLMPCPGTGDVILVPHGLASARLTPENRRELINQLLALDTPTPQPLAELADLV